MEAMTQEPQLTNIQSEKKHAMQEAFDQIENVTGVDVANESKLNAARKLLSEVAGTNYRLEQALAKLVEYFQMELEVEMRAAEIKKIFPGANITSASNEARFLQEDKFLVAV